MNALERHLRRAKAVLSVRKAPWALLGGWAVSIRTEPRFTRDVDLAVAVTGDAEAESIVRAFGEAGYRAGALVEQDATQRLATARLVPAQGEEGILLDLLFASSGIENEICAAAEPLEVLPDLVVPVARPEHLLALKILARDDRTRPQDAGDIAALLRGMEASALQSTRHALRLIQDRGYHRDRNLPALFDAALRDFV